MAETVLHTVFASDARRPSFTSALKVEFPTKPRAPTSIVRSSGSHPAVEMVSVRFKYLDSFLIWAAFIPSSAGQVSSRRMTRRDILDHRIMSGLSLVAQIDGGKTIFLWV